LLSKLLLGRQTALGRFCHYRACIIKTTVYVDGYNLYYGLLRKSPFKWLDLYKLFQQPLLGESCDVSEVRYYTAPILGKLSDDPQSPHRQRTYLQALRKMPPNKVRIIEGRMKASTPYLRLVNSIKQAPEMTHAQVHVLNEKNTDVNMASDLITGAWTGEYEQAVICTNDTDISGALSVIRKHHSQIILGLIAPIPGNDHRKIAINLINLTNWSKVLSPVHLANAQLPEKIPNTSIYKPDSWF
jgi:uncharacterized LabA/DUF88 family protein